MAESECLFDKHEQFIVGQANGADTLEYWMSEHLRVSGIYWGLGGLALMRRRTDERQHPDWEGVKLAPPLGESRITSLSRQGLIDYVKSCRDPRTGAFGGSPGHDPHLLHTLSAVQILLMINAFEEVLPATEASVEDAAAVASLTPHPTPTPPAADTASPPPGSPPVAAVPPTSYPPPLAPLSDGSWTTRVPTIARHSPLGRMIDYVVSLQRADGAFMGDRWGEVDSRFAYCATSLLALCGALDACDVEAIGAWVLRCQNWDGGFGVQPGAESHGGQVFCAVGALSITGALSQLGESGRDRLAWWLAERQGPDGGLNGRPEKKSDVCYSWWVLSCLVMVGRVSYVDRGALVGYMLRCQEREGGGFADKPSNQPDVYHTFFALGGLSLLRWGDDTSREREDGRGGVGGEGGDVEGVGEGPLLEVDPHFVLPKCVLVQRGLAPRFTYSDGSR